MQKRTLICSVIAMVLSTTTFMMPCRAEGVPCLYQDRVGEYDTFGTARGVAARDTFAHVAAGGSGLQIIDVSNQA